MRAAWYERGGPAADVLQVGELPTPDPGAGEVRVRLTLSGINPGDTKKRSAWTGAPLPYPRVIPHSDGAGVIDAVGEGVDQRRIGQRVWVWGAQSYRAFGTAAEYVCVPAHLAVDLPDAVSDLVGATLGIPGITAHRTLLADGEVGGRTVLVHGVRGAVASFAAQLAVARGARVIGTVRRSSDLEQVELPGLAAVVALDSDDPAAQIVAVAPDKVDRVIEVDLAGNVALDSAVMAVGGTIAVYGTSQSPMTLDLWQLLFDNVTLRLFGSDDFPDDAKRLAARELTAAAAEGSLHAKIARVLPLDDIAAAHELVDSGAGGRVLLEL